MFSWFKKQSPPSAPVSPTMRDLLFGDLPLERWTGDGQSAPWNEFARAQSLLQRGEQAGAIAIFEGIARLTDVEVRHTLQAWHFLRELGVQPPPDIAKQVLGVVVEVGLTEGLDVLAAYRDHHARYWNWSGKGVVWENPDNRLDASIDSLLKAAENGVAHIGPGDKERPAAVTTDRARINFLTPSGLHFGEAPFSALAQEPLAAPVINAATRLMQQMIGLTSP
ncbi:hypothetical protein IAD21_02041 [Abditibacteriota bacterium]|nr:hypothetical protein IAD21_02041 [Abditibacteriota bacterium]